MPVILASQKAEISRIVVQNQPGQMAQKQLKSNPSHTHTHTHTHTKGW
jgi:hypothetical protein